MASQITLGKMYLPRVCDLSHAPGLLICPQYPQTSSVPSKSFDVLKVGHLVHTCSMPREHYNKRKSTRVFQNSGYRIQDDLWTSCLKAYEHCENGGAKLSVNTDKENNLHNNLFDVEKTVDKEDHFEDSASHDAEEFAVLEEKDQLQDKPEEYEKESILEDEDEIEFSW